MRQAISDAVYHLNDGTSDFALIDTVRQEYFFVIFTSISDIF
jgi:hypothetical protein